MAAAGRADRARPRPHDPTSARRPRRVRAAVRRQVRRAGRRQGRHRHHGRGDAAAPGAPRNCRTGSSSRSSSTAPRCRCSSLCDGRTARAAAPGPGLQARRRRRPGSEHRRHGRVLAAALGAAGPRRRRSCARSSEPTVAEMARRGTPYSGLLYVGLALTGRGPRVVEFNARFGDPETQAVLARLATPLTGLLPPRRPAAWPGQPRCAGAPGRRSPWSSPPRATPAARQPAT